MDSAGMHIPPGYMTPNELSIIECLKALGIATGTPYATMLEINENVALKIRMLFARGDTADDRKVRGSDFAAIYHGHHVLVNGTRSQIRHHPRVMSSDRILVNGVHKTFAESNMRAGVTGTIHYSPIVNTNVLYGPLPSNMFVQGPDPNASNAAGGNGGSAAGFYINPHAGPNLQANPNPGVQFNPNAGLHSNQNAGLRSDQNAVLNLIRSRAQGFRKNDAGQNLAAGRGVEADRNVEAGHDANLHAAPMNAPEVQNSDDASVVLSANTSANTSANLVAGAVAVDDMENPDGLVHSPVANSPATLAADPPAAPATAPATLPATVTADENTSLNIDMADAAPINDNNPGGYTTGPFSLTAFEAPEAPALAPDRHSNDDGVKPDISSMDQAAEHQTAAVVPWLSCHICRKKYKLQHNLTQVGDVKILFQDMNFADLKIAPSQGPQHSGLRRHTTTLCISTVLARSLA